MLADMVSGQFRRSKGEVRGGVGWEGGWGLSNSRPLSAFMYHDFLTFSRHARLRFVS